MTTGDVVLDCYEDRLGVIVAEGAPIEDARAFYVQWDCRPLAEVVDTGILRTGSDAPMLLADLDPDRYPEHELAVIAAATPGATGMTVVQ